MKCCPECFGDRGLRKSIFPSRTEEVGKCSFCESENVRLLDPRALSEYFGLLLAAYTTIPEENEESLQLVGHFRRDWGLFDHPKMDDHRSRNLLAEIFEDGNIVRRSFIPVPGSANRLGQWEKLRDELMYQNRFFPNADIDLIRLESLLPSLLVHADELPTRWFRARIQNGDQPYSPEEMGAPSRRLASHGRANPAGIPYLYLGSTPETAISEVRPHSGETVCVIDFTTRLDMKLVDLREPRKTVSPFLLEDTNGVIELRSDIPFLERLGQELTRPVVPQSAAIDYTPSQYLCEFIKKCGYSGVIYRSSVVEAGINLALFNPADAQVGRLAQYSVTSVSVNSTPKTPTPTHL
jgi:hypothetical protein